LSKLEILPLTGDWWCGAILKDSAENKGQIWEVIARIARQRHSLKIKSHATLELQAPVSLAVRLAVRLANATRNLDVGGSSYPKICFEYRKKPFNIN
jgi:hypothetical protein